MFPLANQALLACISSRGQFLFIFVVSILELAHAVSDVRMPVILLFDGLHSLLTYLSPNNKCEPNTIASYVFPCKSGSPHYV